VPNYEYKVLNHDSQETTENHLNDLGRDGRRFVAMLDGRGSALLLERERRPEPPEAPAH